jgi:cysteinyl-tRNA synthetase
VSETVTRFQPGFAGLFLSKTETVRNSGGFSYRAMKKSQSQPDALELSAARQNPLPWMLTMEAARQRGDFQAADAARRELERLGIEVRYKQPLSRDGDNAD